MLMLENLAPASLVIWATSELMAPSAELMSPVWLAMKAETSLPTLLAMDSPLEKTPPDVSAPAMKDEAWERAPLTKVEASSRMSGCGSGAAWGAQRG